MNRNQIRLLVLLFMAFPILGVSATNDDGVSVRNPFQSLLLTSCNSAADYLKKWQLRGVVGRQGHYYGWVLKPDGEWHKLVTGQPVFAGWQVSGVGSRRVDMRYEKPNMPCAIALTQVSWSL